MCDIVGVNVMSIVGGASRPCMGVTTRAVSLWLTNAFRDIFSIYSFLDVPSIDLQKSVPMTDCCAVFITKFCKNDKASKFYVWPLAMVAITGSDGAPGLTGAKGNIRNIQEDELLQRREENV